MNKLLNAERILIVDDLASMRRIIYRKLTDEGYQCSTAADGDIALAMLLEHQFSLVLLDITMPKKSGIEVLREVVDRYTDTAVIMITATADAQTAIDLMKLGAYDYIVKPVDINKLIVRVRRALDKRRSVLENKSYQLFLEDKDREQTTKIHQSFMNSTTSLALALEARDKYTIGHSQRVSKIALLIAQQLCIPREQAEKIELAGLLHDIGKIGINESVLMKQGNLTYEEYSHISAHSAIGERILRPVIDDEEILGIVRHHHERYDGKGYPDGLSGNQIPLGARILAVADSYDAMRSDRPYRRALSIQSVLAELKRQASTQFDPVIVEAFVKTVDKGSEREYIRQATLVHQ